jgi:WD40 repeat protein
MVGLLNGVAIAVSSSMTSVNSITNPNDSNSLYAMAMLDTNNAVFAYDDGLISVFSLATQTFTCSTATSPCTTTAPYFRGLSALNSTTFIAGYCDNSVVLWSSQCTKQASNILSSSSYGQISSNLLINSTFLVVGTKKGYALAVNPSANLVLVSASMSIGSSVVVQSLAFSTVNTMLVGGCSNGNIKFWNYTSYTSKNYVLLTSGQSVQAMVVMNDYYVMCAAGSSIYAVVLSTQAVAYTMTGHTNSVNCLTVVSNQLLSGANDSTVKIWAMSSSSPVSSATFSSYVYSLLPFNSTGEFLKNKN